MHICMNVLKTISKFLFNICSTAKWSFIKSYIDYCERIYLCYGKSMGCVNCDYVIVIDHISYMNLKGLIEIYRKY